MTTSLLTARSAAQQDTGPATEIPAYRLATLHEFVGRELGVSDWMPVDQARIDAFAHCTGDHQWIHVDVERARRESPYGGTIAHGYLTLSLVAALSMQAGLMPADARTGVNYGLDKVRFIAPVRAGARIRNRVTLVATEPKGDGRVLVTTENRLEIDGEARPALIAEALAMLVA